MRHANKLILDEYLAAGTTYSSAEHNLFLAAYDVVVYHFLCDNPNGAATLAANLRHSADNRNFYQRAALFTATSVSGLTQFTKTDSALTYSTGCEASLAFAQVELVVTLGMHVKLYACCRDYVR